jgi:GTP cyclohydrolase II
MSLIARAAAKLPTEKGNFTMIAFAESENDWMPHLALVHENMNPNLPVLVRIHSECITGDLFGSKRCDCGAQLNQALDLAAQQGGILLYLRQEGRGIGIINKLKAYNLQDQGYNTIDANLHLGLEIDSRQYDDAIKMLLALDIQQIRLLTNNPEKLDAFDQANIQLVSREPLVIPPEKENQDYLATKLHKMGHLLLPE